MGPKPYKFLLLLAVLSVLNFCPVFSWAEEPVEEAPQEQEAEQKSEKPLDIRDIAFHAEAELNFSAGIEKRNGKLYLILEMDHNISRNSFILGSQLGEMQAKAMAVIRENLAYGFANKPVLYLPLIEMPVEAGLSTENVKFIASSDNNRTYQKIDLSKILDGLSQSGRLIDPSNGNLYQAKEIMEVALLLLEASGEKGPVELSPLRFSLDNLKEGEILQIKGNQPLSDIAERSSYKLGSTVSLEEGYKLPSTTKGRHWMPVGLEASGAVVYKLSPNPKNMGESYVLPKGFPGSFLPEPPEGLMWLKTGESGISQNFELIKAYEGLNPSILSRYVKALIVEMGNATSEAEVGTKIEEFLKRLPFKVNPERQAALIENFKTGNAENFLPLIMREQQVSFLAEWEEARGTQNAVLFCKNIFLK